MKKSVIAIVGILILIIGGVIFWRMKPSTETEVATPTKKRIVQPVNIIPQEERPYISISPQADGRNVTIAVESVKKAADEVEYELEYQAGTLLQGAFGSIDLSSTPATEKILLGSCSAGGACTYHEDVKGGSLTTTFGGAEDYSLKTDWKYIDNSAKESSFSSKDGKFQIEATALTKTRYLIIGNASGIPEGYEGKIASEPYSLELSSSITGEATLSIRAASEESLTILGWSGTSWESFETTQDGKLATATVSVLPLYVVVTQ